MPHYVLTLSCPDRPGIVNAVTGHLLRFEGNILEAQQYNDRETDRFFMIARESKITASPSTSTGTAPGGENSRIRARFSKRCGTRISTTRSSKSMPCSRSASQARRAQLEAFFVPVYSTRVIAGTRFVDAA